MRIQLSRFKKPALGAAAYRGQSSLEIGLDGARRCTPHDRGTRTVQSIYTSQFEPFLHSVVAELDSGVSLTMLSVLARRDLDPWDEASNYARLSPTDAECQLATLIAESVSSPDADPHFIAACLVSLLPSKSAVHMTEIEPFWPVLRRTVAKLKEALVRICQ
jgi:hypothetical protein